MYSILSYYSRVGPPVRSHTAAINVFYIPSSDETPPPQTKGVILCCSGFFLFFYKWSVVERTISVLRLGGLLPLFRLFCYFNGGIIALLKKNKNKNCCYLFHDMTCT